MSNIAMDCPVGLQDILPVLVSRFQASISNGQEWQQNYYLMHLPKVVLLFKDTHRFANITATQNLMNTCSPCSHSNQERWFS